MKSQQFLEDMDDQTASMAKQELLQIAKNAMDTYKMIQQGDKLPAWVSSKLTIANDYLNTANEHMTYRKAHNLGNPSITDIEENASGGATSAGAIAGGPVGGGAGFGKSIFMRRAEADQKKAKKKK